MHKKLKATAMTSLPHKTHLLIALLVTALSAPLSINALAAEPIILVPGTFNPAQILPAPPADNSLEAEAERTTIKTAMADATPAQRAAAQKDAANESVRLFADTLPGFDLDQLPASKALFKTIRANERTQTGIFKNHFHRQRPYQVDSSIAPCLPPKNFDINASDPSGHTTMAFSSAVILANLLPDYAPAIMQRAEVYGQHRIVCGAHHPFDVRSGQVLGTLIGTTLLKSPELQAQLTAARTELKRHIASPTPLAGREWIAMRINGDNVSGNAPTLTIENGKAYGSSGCNRYTGSLTLGGKDALQFGPAASTRMACPGNADQQEAAYFKALGTVTSYHLNNGTLILLDAAYNKVLEYRHQ
ncbi:MAG: META domain-containing protein [Fluviibacter sp.]